MLAIPSKRHDKRQVHFLTRPEIEAVLAAPDRTTWLGRRDHTLLLLAAQTGLRLSELTGLDRDAVHIGSGAHVRCLGKGRKERTTPLTTLARRALQVWLKEPVRKGATALFPNMHGGRLTPRRNHCPLEMLTRAAQIGRWGRHTANVHSGATSLRRPSGVRWTPGASRLILSHNWQVTGLCF